MVDTVASLGIETKVTGAKEGSQDLDKLNQSVKNVAQSTKDLGAAQQQSATGIKAATTAQAALGASTTATAQSASMFQKLFGSLASVFGAHATGATSATNATHAFRNALHTLDPILVSSGMGMGNLGAFAMAARAGIAGLGIAIVGGLAVGIERTIEKLASMRQQIKDLSPSSEAGQRAIDSLDASVRRTGVSGDALSRIFQTLTKAERDFGSGVKSVAVPGFESMLKGMPGATDVTGTIDALSTIFRLAKATQPQIDNVATALEGMGAEGKFTKEIFVAVEKASTGVAKAIATAFGTTDIKAFQERLAQGPILVRNFDGTIARSGETAKASLQKATAGADDFNSAIGKLKAEWEDFASTVGDSTLGVAAINGLTEALKGFEGEIKAVTRIYGNLINFISTHPVSTGTSSMPSFNNPSSLVNPMGDLAGPAFDLPQFASGGIARVTGAAGIDKTLVQFMATNGEVVAVGNPSAANAISGSSGVPVSMITQPITMAVQSSTNQIVTAINNPANSPTINIGGPGGFSLQIPRGSMYGQPAGSSTYGNQYTPYGPQEMPAPFVQSAGGYFAPVASNSGPGLFSKGSAGWNGLGGVIGGGGAGAGSGGGGGGIVGGGGGVMPDLAGATWIDSPALTNYQNAMNASSYMSGSASSYDTTVADYYNQMNGSGTMNGSYAGSDITNQLNNAYTIPDSAGNFASGGSFRVGGPGGTDSKRVSMNVTPGEVVSVAPPQSKKRIGGESQRPIIFNFPNSTPQAFMASGAQVARALRNALR